MRKHRDKPITQPARFVKDGQSWEVVWQTSSTAYAVRISKKGQAYGIVEKFHEYV